jgi:hypothetical protein
MLSKHDSTRTLAAEPRAIVDPKDARRLLGVASYTTHRKLPNFLNEGIKSFTKQNWLSFFTQAPAEKKRERYLLLVLLVGGVLYLGSYALNFLTSSQQEVAISQLINDPQFQYHLENLKKEKNTKELTPEIFQEAYKRYHQ